ncbi:MAG: cation-translocating P-type ATPase [Moorella sp. (in: Bacteria)]|nr:cation-translocating P-type ATPase [Moorella sp. (in: firmicutes)]
MLPRGEEDNCRGYSWICWERDIAAWGSIFLQGVSPMAFSGEKNSLRPEVVHRLPGRLRLHLPGLARRKQLAGELASRLAALPGIRRAVASPVSGRVLLQYDLPVDWQLLVRQVGELWLELLSRHGAGGSGEAGDEPRLLPNSLAAGTCQEGKDASQTAIRTAGEDGRLGGRMAAVVLGGAAIALVGLKRLFYGPAALAGSHHLFHLAVGTNLLTAYPSLLGAKVTTARPPAWQKTLGIIGLGTALLRESLPGLTLFWLSSVAAAMDALVRRRCHRAGGGKGTDLAGGQDGPPARCAELTATYMAETAGTALGLSAITGLFTANPSRALAMLVAANPAGGRKSLSMTGAAVAMKAGRLGIYVPDSGFWQRLCDVDTVFFEDAGLFILPVRMGEVLAMPGVRPRDLLDTAAGLARRAGHPLAALFPSRVEEQPVEVLFSGPLELRGRIGTESAFVGPVIKTGKLVDQWINLKSKQLIHLGQVPLGVVRQGRFLGLLGVHYAPRPGSEQVVAGLAGSGIHNVTGAVPDRALAPLLKGLGLDVTEEDAPEEPGRAGQAHRTAGLGVAGRRVARVLVDPEGRLLVQIRPGQGEMVIPDGDLGKLSLAFRLARIFSLRVQENIHFLRMANYLGLFLAATGRISLLKALLYHDLSNLLLAVNACRELFTGNSSRKPVPGNGGRAPGCRTKPPSLQVLSGASRLEPARPFNGNGWARLTPAEVVKRLKTDARQGLEEREAARRLGLYGPNRLPEGKPPGFWSRFAAQLQNLMVQTLMGSSVVCLFLGEVGDALAIITIVVLNAIFGVLQEQKAETALAALREMTAPTARVIRGGRPVEAPAAELVPGDVVLLEQGDGVPADIRLISVENLAVEEAALTGESFPVPKHAAALEDCLMLHDCHNMVFMGTSVTSGKAAGVVVATALETEVGKIAGMLQTGEEETPLQKRLGAISRGVLLGCLAVSGLVFLAGVLRGERPLNMFMTGVSLAVAAIPEGLPATVTIALAAGVWRMARKRAVVRRLSGVETLGSVTVICSDKTGTLTRNEQTVQAIYTAGRVYQVTGTGYEAKGEILYRGRRVAVGRQDVLRRTLAGAVLCSDARLHPGEGENSFQVWGDPLEGAILVSAWKAGMDPERLRRENPRMVEIPFDPERGRMTVACREEDGTTLYAKGAPEAILDLCSQVWLADGPRPLDEEKRRVIAGINRQMARRALRVLAVACRPGIEPDKDLAGQEQEMIFLGLLGMVDPLREEARAAVERCRRAGVRVVMITGDQPHTARALAGELGLVGENGTVLVGRQIEKMSDAELVQAVGEVNIFARVMPRHKLRLVKALRDAGHVVAMIGDGANDAPAVKSAHVGIAMGKGGTQVTREASTMIITDDNFATVVEAVAEGRGIYASIRRSVRYQLATNAGEVLLMFLAVALGLPLPLAPIHLLWLNILGDGLPALALGLDRPAANVMEQQPRPISARFFDREYTGHILSRGLAIGLSALAGYLVSLARGKDLTGARTVVLGTLTLSQLLYAVQCRRDSAMGANRFLTGSLALSGGLLLGACYLPGMRSFLKTSPPGPFDWLVMGLGVGLSVVLDCLVYPIIGTASRLAREKELPLLPVSREPAPEKTPVKPCRSVPVSLAGPANS